MTDVGHTARRPQWTCTACGQPWPCPPARVGLGEQYAGQRAALAMYMAARLHEAVYELQPPFVPAELWERFVAWTR